MVSPSRSTSSHVQEILRLCAKSLFTHDPTPFLALLEHLFASEKIFNVHRSDARQLVDFAHKEYPDSLVICLLTHLRRSPRDITRSRCAIILLRIFRPHHNLYDRLSPTAQNELKTVLRRIREETLSATYMALITLVTDIATLLLPKKQWPEVYDYMFQSLKTDSHRDNHCAVLLFTKLIPRLPPLFLFHVDDLSEAFMGIMNATWEDHTVSGAAVGDSVKLILHLTTPSNHCKYYDLLKCMGQVLIDTVDDMESDITHRILEDMIVLAGAETRFLRSNIDFLVEKMLDVAEDNLASNRTKELTVEFVITVAEDREYGCGMIQNTHIVFLKTLFNVLLHMFACIDYDPCWDGSSNDLEDEGMLGNCSYADQAFSRLVKVLRENIIVRSIPYCLPDILENRDWKRRHAAITAIGIIADGCSKASLAVSETLLEMCMQLSMDLHPRVRWATIREIGQFSKNWGLHSRGDVYINFLHGLIVAMEDFAKPWLQAIDFYESY